MFLNERWCEMVCDKVEGGGGGGAEAEAGRDTESKTRTHIKMRGKRPSGVLVEFSAFYKHSQITALRKLMPQRLLNKQW
jgi:hypothetical protein